MFARMNTLDSPFAQMNRMVAEMDRLLGGVARAGAGSPVAGLFPPVNVWEHEDSVFVEAEIPGIPMSAVEVSVLGDELTLKASRRPAGAPEHENGAAIRRERWTGEFERTLSLPFPVDAERVEATLRDGVLTVKLPKAASARPRRVEVKALPSGA